uniref:ETFB lysine methyltransferase n=1 Tax=Ascaris suum TaxID=6253 RepID=F1L5R4_ASCSU
MALHSGWLQSMLRRIRHQSPKRNYQQRPAIMVALSTRQVVKWILRNTCKSRESLTPEIALRLITETCPMWMATPDQCPLHDPYWAFYWPGGQALARFILDNRQLFVGSYVLDFGAGCGATSIAAIRSGAQHVLTNDIDISAILAARLNFKLNKTAHWSVTFSNANLLLPYNEPIWSAFTSGRKSYILLGDMFYDTEFATVVLKWLQRVRNQSDVSILVGDPGRHPLADQNHRSRIGVEFKECLIDEYALPGYVTKEHYGFTSSKVFQLDLL